MFKIYTVAPENTWFEWMFSGYEEWGGEQLSKDEAHWMPPFSTTPFRGTIQLCQNTRKDQDILQWRVLSYGRTKFILQCSVERKPRRRVRNRIRNGSPWHDAPNRIQSMIRCPTNKQLIVEPCINKDYKFRGEWPTNYSEHILKKTSSSKEAYGKFCFDVDS